MRKTLVASSVAAALATLPNDEYGQAFKNFETVNKKSYASEQERYFRFDIFKHNYIHIAKENAKNDNSYELGVNEFTDMTPEEFAGTHFGYVKAAQRFQGAKNLGVHEYQGEALPTSVDWRSKGAVTPVKNQASCGSCWAFSTTGSMEGAWAIASGKLVSLSEEQLVACSKQNHGCQGGSMELGFMYEEGTAVCTEQSYPYTSGGGSVGACKASSCTAGIPKGGISGYKTIASNKNSLMSAVAQQPTSIAVEADKSVFQSYRSGVMTGMCGTNLDHGILAIGYGTESGKDYWLVKNSWGTSWGEAGYGKLERGKGGTGECGILSDDSYPVAKDTTLATPPRYSKGYKRSQYGANMPVAEITDEDIASAPNAVDWSAKGATTSVNDQGSCGSCWAFSTTETVESAVFMSSGKLPGHLSVQELVACEKQDDGCDGGDIPEAVTYLKKHGMASNSDYPDSSSKSGKTGRCTWNKESVVTVTGMKYAIPPCTSGNCANQNEEALAAALAKYGPLGICINSGDGQSGDWMPYKSGILKGSCKAKASLIDHCVQLVGYDKSGGYWKIRNSWGKSWGENGFIRIPYGNKNECCVGCEAVIISATQSAGNEVVV